MTRITACVLTLVMTGVTAAAFQQAPPPPPPTQSDPSRVVTRDASGAPGTPGAGPPTIPLPALSQEARLLVDQLKQSQAGMIQQLRMLQQLYRDAGHAEDAAAIAAHVRIFQSRLPTAVTGNVTAELVNEGLQNRDEPVRMAMFRGRSGETLSFAIRGRDDQSVWGTTVYTDDSGLETAAVHAGLLRAGQIGIVKVRVLPGQDKYQATAQNAIQSREFSRHEGSFRFSSVTVIKPARTSSLSSYRDLVGYSVLLPVVGTAGGSVWGTDVFTDDSSLAAAAVHSGALTAGEFGFVKVTLMQGQDRYEGSQRNGVTSESYERFEGSFRVERAPQPWTVQLPGGEDASSLVRMDSMRGRTDISFVVQIIGSTSGTVWGSGPYTDDSSISSAAVHAGLVKVGETAFVRVTIVTGSESYQGSERNGIKSQPYGKWEGSFRLSK